MDTTITDTTKVVAPIDPQINAGLIGNTNGIIVPPAPEPTNLLAGLASTTQQTADQSTAQEKTAQTDFTSLLKQLEGETTDIISAENQQNLPGLNKELLDLQKVANKQTAEYIAGYAGQEAKRNTRQETTVAQQNLTRQNAIDALLTNSLISAKQGDITFANSLVDRAIKAKYDPLKARIETQKEILRQVEGKASEDRKNALNLQLKQIEKDEQREKTVQNLSLEAAKNGAPSSILSKLAKAKTFEEALVIGGGYMADPLDRSIKAAQLRKLQMENVANDPAQQQAIINSVVNEKDPTKLIANFFKVNPKLKTNQPINDAAAVVSSANELAKTLGAGKIKGYGVFGGGFTPEAFLSQEGISNTAKVKALNLKVQQWASGASLTKQQTKYVKAMIPEANDTDATFRNKVNNLTNYMLSDIKGRATTQGGQFEYVPVELFNAKEESVTPDVKKSVVQAMSSGYQPTEIIQFVEETYPDKAVQIKQARDNGYSEEEIINYLSL